jgi:hypothetical protein
MKRLILKRKSRAMTSIIDTGTVEAAEQWWNLRGRDMLRHRQFSEDTRTQQANMDVINPLHPNFIGGFSGILQGNRWADLNIDERMRVVSVFASTSKK